HTAPALHADPLSLHDALPIVPRAEGRTLYHRHARQGQRVLHFAHAPATAGYRPGLRSAVPGQFHAGHLRDIAPVEPRTRNRGVVDRKSTRLNSSHVKTSYAVF